VRDEYLFGKQRPRDVPRGGFGEDFRRVAAVKLYVAGVPLQGEFLRGSYPLQDEIARASDGSQIFCGNAVQYGFAGTGAKVHITRAGDGREKHRAGGDGEIHGVSGNIPDTDKACICADSCASARHRVMGL